MHNSPVYRTKRWRETRRLALARDGHRCRSCGSAGRLEVHHVRPLRDGGEPYDLSNLQTKCRSCHVREHHPVPAWRPCWEHFAGELADATT